MRRRETTCPSRRPSFSCPNVGRSASQGRSRLASCISLAIKARRNREITKMRSTPGETSDAMRIVAWEVKSPMTARPRNPSTSRSDFEMDLWILAFRSTVGSGAWSAIETTALMLKRHCFTPAPTNSVALRRQSIAGGRAERVICARSNRPSLALHSTHR